MRDWTALADAPAPDALTRGCLNRQMHAEGASSPVTGNLAAPGRRPLFFGLDAQASTYGRRDSCVSHRLRREWLTPQAACRASSSNSSAGPKNSKRIRSAGTPRRISPFTNALRKGLGPQR